MQLIERFGTLGVLFVGIAYAAHWMAKKVVEPLVSSHTGLVDQLKISDGRQSDTLEKQADTLATMAASHHQQAETLASIAETQKEICRIITPK